MPELAGKSVNNNDAAVLIAGAAYFLASFLPYVGFTGSAANDLTSLGGGSSANAWHGITILAIFLMMAATGLVALRVFDNVPDLPVGPRQTVLALTGVAAVITVIRVLTLSDSAFGISIGPKFGAWAMLILAVVAAAFAFMAFRESGETMPSAGGDTGSPSPGV